MRIVCTRGWIYSILVRLYESYIEISHEIGIIPTCTHVKNEYVHKTACSDVNIKYCTILLGFIKYNQQRLKIFFLEVV